MKKYVLYFLLGAFVFLGFGGVLHSEVLAAGGNGFSSYEDNFGDSSSSDDFNSDHAYDLGEIDASYVSACVSEECKAAESKKNNQTTECNGIKLNTNFPLVGDCISTKKDGNTNPTNAFPKMMGALTKIVMSLVLVVCFILIIYAGILWSADNPKEAKKWLTRVAITILLLGFSGVILKLINPNFFS